MQSALEQFVKGNVLCRTFGLFLERNSVSTETRQSSFFLSCCHSAEIISDHHVSCFPFEVSFLIILPLPPLTSVIGLIHCIHALMDGLTKGIKEEEDGETILFLWHNPPSHLIFWISDASVAKAEVRCQFKAHNKPERFARYSKSTNWIESYSAGLLTFILPSLRDAVASLAFIPIYLYYLFWLGHTLVWLNCWMHADVRLRNDPGQVSTLEIQHMVWI